MAAVVLNRALFAIRRGGGLLLTPTRVRNGWLAAAPYAQIGRIALKIAFMLFFTGNGGTLGILFQLQMEWLTLRLAALAAKSRQACRDGVPICIQTQLISGTVQAA